MSFVVKYYDLGQESEVVGYYKEAVKGLKEEKDYIQIGSDRIEYFQSEEFKKKDNIDRAVRRAKTKIRRTAEKYNLKYMWTMTFAKRETKIHNPQNKKTYTYDVSEWEDAWKVFALFIKRCRKNGLHFNYIVTAEIQEKRLEEYGEKVYHFHMATDRWIPQNEDMRKKHNRSHSYDERFDYSFNDFWTFGFTKGTKRTGQRLCVNYLVKYITKAFELENVKNKQRYHISNGMNVEFEIIEFADHIELMRWANDSMKLDKWGNPVSKYFVLGSTLEIWWLKLIKNKMEVLT